MPDEEKKVIDILASGGGFVFDQSIFKTILIPRTSGQSGKKGNINGAELSFKIERPYSWF